MGVSVLELVHTFGKVTGKTVSYELKPRREGDISSMYSNGERAKQELGWTPRFTLDQMCKCIFRTEEVFFFCFLNPQSLSRTLQSNRLLSLPSLARIELSLVRRCYQRVKQSRLFEFYPLIGRIQPKKFNLKF